METIASLHNHIVVVNKAFLRMATAIISQNKKPSQPATKISSYRSRRRDASARWGTAQKLRRAVLHASLCVPVTPTSRTAAALVAKDSAHGAQLPKSVFVSPILRPLPMEIANPAPPSPPMIPKKTNASATRVTKAWASSAGLVEYLIIE